MKLGLLTTLLLTAATMVHAQEYLVRFNSDEANVQRSFFEKNGGRFELVSKEGQLYKWTTEAVTFDDVLDSSVKYIQKNNEISIFQSPSLIANRDAILSAIATQGLFSRGPAYPDNPEIQSPSIQSSGPDPLLAQAWGIASIGASVAWAKGAYGKGIVVAVTDTGVDYNHEDLINNMWRNKGEIAGNQIDDDHNGFVDDIVGWDFASNDNKPYDLSMSMMDVLLSGGNPGHGSHVSGVIAASLNNALGSSGVATQASIMAVRFINETGKGDTAAAVKAIDYAVANGANIINASWGGEKGDDDDTALKEALQRAQAKGVLFVAAAGNGRPDAAGTSVAGFDNDSDPKPMVPASYNYPNMISVAAIDSDNKLASFSNWGAKSCVVAAPGVKIMSTIPHNIYQDTIVDLGSVKATWDGTSMASPFVAGTAAVIWGQNKTQTYDQVKAKLMALSVPTDSVKGKVLTNGRVDLHGITN